MNRVTFLGAALLAVLVSSPAAAQWTRVAGVPPWDVFALFAGGDTLLAATDTSVYVSTNAGTTWQASRRPAPNVTLIQSVRMRNGRLYAGTRGQGVFVSDDRGATWQAFNQGLVGGLFDTQLDVADLEVRGDSLFAATFGAGVWARRLSGVSAWFPFGAEFEPNQASNVRDLALGGTRLLASVISNGIVFRRDPGEPDWTLSPLDNIGIHPALSAQSAAWNGHGWVVGSNLGVFRSSAGQEPWTRVDPGLGPIFNTAFAGRGRTLFVAFDIVNNAVAVDSSADDGATWQPMDILPQTFVYQMAMVRNVLFAGRADGLWRRTGGTVAVPPGVAPPGLRLAIRGRQPVDDEVRLVFELPEATSAAIEVFDVRGRRVVPTVRGSWSAGPHEIAIDTGALRPGVYAAALVAHGQRAVARIVRR